MAHADRRIFRFHPPKPRRYSSFRFFPLHFRLSKRNCLASHETAGSFTARVLGISASVLALLNFLAGHSAAQQLPDVETPGTVITCGIDTEPQPVLEFRKRDASQVMSVASFRIDPTVIRNNGTDTFSLSVGTDTNVAFLKIHNSPGFLYRDSSLQYLQLFDDGTHGDQVAGDKIFTLDQIRFWWTPIFNGRSILTAYPFIDSVVVTFTDSSTETQFVNLYPPVRFIDAAVVPIPSITAVHPDMYKTDYCVNIVSPFAAPDYDIDVQQISQRYYADFSDDRDFLIVADLFNRIAATVAGRFFSVRNDVQGIGKSIYNYTSDYGSSGNLHGLVHMLGGANAGLLAHELLHRWAAFFDASLGLALGTHWKAIQRPSSGFGPYWGAHNRFEYLSGRSYRGWFNPDSTFGYYSDFELYLMGLVAAADVLSPIQTLANPTDNGVAYDAVTRTTYRSFEADSIRDVTMDEIVSIQGERLPSFETSQKEFSSSLIVVYDRPLTEVEFAYYDLFAREYEKSNTTAMSGPSFQQATGGRAAMTTRISGEAATTAPAIPVLSAPPTGATGVPTSPILTWNPVGDATTYRLQVSTRSAFDTTVFNDLVGVTTSMQVGPLQANTRYYWRVNAMNTVGTSPFSSPWYFTTSTVSAAEDARTNSLPAEFTLSQNYPNPFNPTTIIRFGVPTRSRVLLTVHNLLGQQVKQLANEEVEPGFFEKEWSAGVSSGLYFYRLEAVAVGDPSRRFVDVKKVILVR